MRCILLPNEILLKTLMMIHYTMTFQMLIARNQKLVIWFPEAYKLLTMLWKTQTNLPPVRDSNLITGKGITLNAHYSTVYEDQAGKVKHFIITNQKHITCFSETSLIPNIYSLMSQISSSKQIKCSATSFQQVALFSLLFCFYRAEYFCKYKM